MEALRWETWGQAHFLFHRASGQTHFLNETGRLIVDRLQEGRASTRLLYEKLLAHYGIDEDSALLEAIGDVLDLLERAGVVAKV